MLIHLPSMGVLDGVYFGENICQFVGSKEEYIRKNIPIIVKANFNNVILDNKDEWIEVLDKDLCGKIKRFYPNMRLIWDESGENVIDVINLITEQRREEQDNIKKKKKKEANKRGYKSSYKKLRPLNMAPFLKK